MSDWTERWPETPEEWEARKAGLEAIARTMALVQVDWVRDDMRAR